MQGVQGEEVSKPTDLPSFAWGDPAKVAERLESMTCKGCANKETGTVFEVTMTFCKIKKNYDGIRCKQYKGGMDGRKR